MIPAGTVDGQPVRPPMRPTQILARRPELRGMFPVADAVDSGDRD